MEDGLYLAIDTSTEMAGLALARGQKVLSELTWRSRRNHSAELLPNLSFLLQGAPAQPTDLAGVVVALGPGSYNGLRAGLSTAKGLAFALQIPLVGVSTLEALAYAHQGSPYPVCPLLKAGRGEVALALFRKTAEGWTKLRGEGITTLAAFCPQLSGPTLFCGELDEEMAQELRHWCGAAAVLVTPAPSLGRAGWLLELGLQRLLRGERDDPVTLQPLYLRRPSITLKGQGQPEMTRTSSSWPESPVFLA